MIRIIACGLALAATISAPLAAEDESAAWDKLQDEAARLTDGLPEDADASQKMLAKRMTTHRADFRKFLESYPQSTNRWDARMSIIQLDNYVAGMEGRQPDIAAHTAELQSIAADKEAPENIRADAGLVLLQIASLEFDNTRTEAAAKSLSAAINKFLETHPEDARAPALRLTEAQALEAFDPARARTLYDEAAKNEDPEISTAAKDAIKLMALRDKPLELSFTAVDGSKVDLASLRGKVVLVDFWATWCAPCVEEVPAVVEAYGKFKDKGFEIVGISLDSDKAALEEFTTKNKMTWPQYFDGKGWENEMAKRFGIQSVPTMWLLDREGKLADPAPRGRLMEAVEKALAKP